MPTKEFENRKVRRKIEWSDRSQKNAYERERRAKHGNRERQLKTRYGITLAQFDEMVKDQNGLCACCKERLPIDVDHCHQTNALRGILCRACNVGIGLLGDSLDGLLRAVEYLKNSK